MSRIKIDPKKFYTLYEVARDDLFETGYADMEARRARARRIVGIDKMSNDYLKAAFVPDEMRLAKKYAIKGTGIILWLANKDANSSN